MRNDCLIILFFQKFLKADFYLCLNRYMNEIADYVKDVAEGDVNTLVEEYYSKYDILRSIPIRLTICPYSLSP